MSINYREGLHNGVGLQLIANGKRTRQEGIWIEVKLGCRDQGMPRTVTAPTDGQDDIKVNWLQQASEGTLYYHIHECSHRTQLQNLANMKRYMSDGLFATTVNQYVSRNWRRITTALYTPLEPENYVRFPYGEIVFIQKYTFVTNYAWNRHLTFRRVQTCQSLVFNEENYIPWVPKCLQ